MRCLNVLDAYVHVDTSWGNSFNEVTADSAIILHKLKVAKEASELSAKLKIHKMIKYAFKAVLKSFLNLSS